MRCELTHGEWVWGVRVTPLSFRFCSRDSAWHGSSLRCPLVVAARRTPPKSTYRNFYSVKSLWDGIGMPAGKATCVWHFQLFSLPFASFYKGCGILWSRVCRHIQQEILCLRTALTTLNVGDGGGLSSISWATSNIFCFPYPRYFPIGYRGTCAGRVWQGSFRLNIQIKFCNHNST